MGFYLKLYALTVPIFFIIDIIWLGMVARRLYREQLGSIINFQVNWTAAILFYLIYIVGIIVFAVRPAINGGSVGPAVMWGALFGFFTYATYDLTNLATIKNWPLTIVMIDMVWGSILCTIVATLSYLISKWLV